MNTHCTKVFKSFVLGLTMLGAGVGFQAMATETQLLVPGWQLWALGFLIITPIGVLALAWGGLRLIERGGKCCGAEELCS